MLRKSHFLFVALLPLFMLLSCKKERHGENKFVTLNVSVNAGDTYRLDLSPYGDADDLATITKQAVTYLTSEISKGAADNFIYSFAKAGSPKMGGNGTELVVLKITEPEGRCRNHDETTVTINFTIN
jgi:hypothetical protein